MTALNVINQSQLNQIQIASPCDASWDEMRGDSRQRHCAHCDKNVYNLSGMTRREIAELIERTEGVFCGRLYRRTDGTVLTADCPVGLLERATRTARRAKAAAITLVVALSGGILAGLFGGGECASGGGYTMGEPMPMGKIAVEPADDLPQEEREVPQPAPQPEVIMGAMVAPSDLKSE